ncbi:hypothetical protein CSV71_14910 [Sporosarcina sp. P21c]|uniref:hypothetical protein n=1 Tax=Sporosarcina sp. P21c TaxID=2048255 RepID=UPI000C164F20|nr:hypothetical protein [Sporosarcina sp. P21c]PIC88414.1 hypothetical protein CSV71_14910 [Sporosarcina sp. P21c]
MAKETLETFTVEKYNKMKAGNATDGAITSMLGTYPAKFIAWKRENGLMEDKPKEDTPVAVQDDTQRTESNSSPEDYKAKYEALSGLLQVSENKYKNLLEERNELFDKSEELKTKAELYDNLAKNYDDVWQQLQNERVENTQLKEKLECKSQSTAYNQQAEMEYRQLKSRYHALEDEMAALQDVKQLSVLLASQYVAASREVVE